MPIPVWSKFLDEIMLGDQELIAYVRRVLGYCLTGSTREHALFFGYGLGANGKSTLLTAIDRCIGRLRADRARRNIHRLET